MIDYYDQEARDYHQRRDTKKADLALTKKKLAMKEVTNLFLSLIHFFFSQFHSSRLIHFQVKLQQPQRNFDLLFFFRIYYIYYFCQCAFRETKIKQQTCAFIREE